MLYDGGMKQWVIVAWAGMSLAAPASAGLQFEAERVSHTAKHSENEATIRFDFKVAGDRPVKILDIRTLCGCLSATTDGNRMEYGPGDTGRVTAVFSLGSFEGQQEKQVVLTTDDPGRKEVVLTAAVTIPPLYEINPPQAKWTVGDPPETKTITVKMLGDEPVRVTEAVSTREAMKVAVKEVVAGREYVLELTPDTTGNPLLGMVRIQTDSPYQRYQRRLVFFNIARPGSRAAAAADRAAQGSAAGGSQASRTAEPSTVTPPAAIPPKQP